MHDFMCYTRKWTFEKWKSEKGGYYCEGKIFSKTNL